MCQLLSLSDSQYPSHLHFLFVKLQAQRFTDVVKLCHTCHLEGTVGIPDDRIHRILKRIMYLCIHREREREREREMDGETERERERDNNGKYERENKRGEHIEIEK